MAALFEESCAQGVDSVIPSGFAPTSADEFEQAAPRAPASPGATGIVEN